MHAHQLPEVEPSSRSAAQLKNIQLWHSTVHCPCVEGNKVAICLGCLLSVQMTRWWCIFRCSLETRCLWMSCASCAQFTDHSSTQFLIALWIWQSEHPISLIRLECVNGAVQPLPVAWITCPIYYIGPGRTSNWRQTIKIPKLKKCLTKTVQNTCSRTRIQTRICLDKTWHKIAEIVETGARQSSVTHQGLRDFANHTVRLCIPTGALFATVHSSHSIGSMWICRFTMEPSYWCTLGLWSKLWWE